MFISCQIGDDECQIDSDCNDNPDVRSDECKPGYKNMTTNCECLKEMWCRDKPKGSRDFDDCPLWCYPKKVEDCNHWGGDCNVCQQTRGSNPCIYKDVIGTCQDNGKCDYPDNSMYRDDFEIAIKNKYDCENLSLKYSTSNKFQFTLCFRMPY